LTVNAGELPRVARPLAHSRRRAIGKTAWAPCEGDAAAQRFTLCGRALRFLIDRMQVLRGGIDEPISITKPSPITR